MSTAPTQEFQGFGPDARAFLAGLEADNSKAYFDAHRAVYDTQVAGPLRQLVTDVGEQLQSSVAPAIDYAPKVGGSLFRINRDLRFSKDKTPYHPHLDVAWWEGDHPKSSPAFILRIRHDTVLTGVGVFGFGDHTDRFRSAVMGEAGIELDEIVATLRKRVRGVSVSEPRRKRVPKGFDAAHPRAAWLLHDGLHLRATVPTPTSLTSPRFASWVVDRLTPYADVHQWLVRNV